MWIHIDKLDTEWKCYITYLMSKWVKFTRRNHQHQILWDRNMFSRNFVYFIFICMVFVHILSLENVSSEVVHIFDVLFLFVDCTLMHVFIITGDYKCQNSCCRGLQCWYWVSRAVGILVSSQNFCCKFDAILIFYPIKKLRVYVSYMRIF